MCRRDPEHTGLVANLATLSTMDELLEHMENPRGCTTEGETQDIPADAEFRAKVQRRPGCTFNEHNIVDP